MQPLSPTDPRTAGEYTLRARLGAGGMGRVYLGYSPAGRAVAVKVVHPELARDEEFLARFRNEVTAARMVSGMYTAPVVASGLGDDPPWLATVYVPGAPLDDVVSKNGPLPEAAVWRLAAGLTEALQAVHASGLVHRDLKPSNVLLATDGPHVIDFGISRAMGGSHLTATGIVVGTPGYMSPEQAEGHEAGPPSDVFSLACVVAFAATGKQPFGTGSAASVLFRVVAGQPDLDGIPPQLRQVLEGCLRKNPAERPQLPTLLGAFSRGAGSVADEMQSPTSFWPRPVEDVIRAAAQGAPGSPGTGSGAASPVSPPPGALQGAPSGFQSPPQGSPYSPPQPSMPVPPQAPGPYAGHPGAYAGQPGAYTGQPSAQAVYPSASGYQPPSYGHAVPQGPPTPPPAPQPQTRQSPGLPAGYATPPSPYQQPAQQPVMQPPAQQAPGWQATTPQVPQTPHPGQVPWAGPGIGQPLVPGPQAFQPARRKPTRAEVPPPVVSALRVMYTGLGATILAFIIGIADMGHLDHISTTTADPVTQSVAQTSLGILALFTFCSGIIGFVFWPLCAWAVRKGRQWGAVVGTVFFGLDLISMLFVLIGAHGAPASMALSLVVWVLGLVAVIFLWSRESRAFYQAFR